MSDWMSSKLGDVIELQRGHDLPSDARGDGDIPIIGSFGVTGFHDLAKYPGPGVAIGRSGASIGSATYVPGPYWPLNTCLFVSDFKGNDASWVFRLLDLIDFQSFNSGSAQPSLNRNFLRAIPVLLPSPAEQRAIAEVLGALDDKIAANTKRATTIEDLISALYSLARGQGFQSAPLFDVLDMTYGEPFAGALFSEPEIGRPLIRIRDLKTFRSQIWTTEIRTRETLVAPGDIVIGMDAEFRATVWLGEPGLLNQRVCRATSRDYGSAFVREVLREPLAARENDKSATTVIHLNKSDLERSTVAMPTEAELRKFDSRAEPMLACIVELATENRTLAELRDTLLPQLMSGGLRVRDAETIVSEVV